MKARIKAYFVIASVEPRESPNSGFYAKVLIKWEGKTGRPHRWGYTTFEGDALQAYKETVEWIGGKRKRHDGMKWNQKKYELVQHDWRKTKP
jgi:hypothetical protein